MQEERKAEGSYGGSYAVGIDPSQLKVPYIAIGAPYGMEEVEAIAKALQGESLTMSSYVEEF